MGIVKISLIIIYVIDIIIFCRYYFKGIKKVRKDMKHLKKFSLIFGLMWGVLSVTGSIFFYEDYSLVSTKALYEFMFNAIVFGFVIFYSLKINVNIRKN